jgi:hypothetical protein
MTDPRRLAESMRCDGCHAPTTELARTGHRGNCTAKGRHQAVGCDLVRPWPACYEVQVFAFGHWLGQQAGREDAVGDLARDYTRDDREDDERDPSPAGVRAELDDHDAMPSAYDVLDRAAAEWQASTDSGRTRP